MNTEQKRDYIARIALGWRAANEDQAANARQRSEIEKGAVADELQRLSDALRGARRLPEIAPEEHGLVEQQRYFQKGAKSA